MNIIKKIFTKSTGYWIHKLSSLPVGTDLYIDIHQRFGYGPLNAMFDVGANIGQTYEWFRNNEPKAKIYCFEPVLAPFQQLKLLACSDKNCVLENIALGDTVGKKTIKVFDKYSYLNSLKDELMNHDSNAKEEIINIDTLDNYCIKKEITKIDILKIDTEGYELNVIAGGREMLNNAQVSFIFCEAGFLKSDRQHTNFQDLSEWLAARNYFFVGLYGLSLHAWKYNSYFGNALFAHRGIYKY